jgi:hypothetical protein
LALRLLVPLAALQILVVYPVSGAQLAWGTVAMLVPCAVGVAVGLDQSRAWRELGWLKQTGVAAFGCVALFVATAVWPTTMWHTYTRAPSLGLPGTGLMRLDPGTAANLRATTAALQANCDTFYGSPNLNSFYIFTELPPVTGMVANGGTAALTTEQQQQVIDALERKTAAGERVCILRDGTVPPVEDTPLGKVLQRYPIVVAAVGNYTISRVFDPNARTPLDGQEPASPPT